MLIYEEDVGPIRPMSLNFTIQNNELVKLGLRWTFCCNNCNKMLIY